MQKKHLSKPGTHSSTLLENYGMQGNFPNLVKTSYERPAADVILKG